LLCCFKGEKQSTCLALVALTAWQSLWFLASWVLQFFAVALCIPLPHSVGLFLCHSAVLCASAFRFLPLCCFLCCSAFFCATTSFLCHSAVLCAAALRFVLLRSLLCHGAVFVPLCHALYCSSVIGAMALCFVPQPKAVALHHVLFFVPCCLALCCGTFICVTALAMCRKRFCGCVPWHCVCAMALCFVPGQSFCATALCDVLQHGAMWCSVAWHASALRMPKCFFCSLALLFLLPHFFSTTSLCIVPWCCFLCHSIVASATALCIMPHVSQGAAPSSVSQQWLLLCSNVKKYNNNQLFVALAKVCWLLCHWWWPPFIVFWQHWWLYWHLKNKNKNLPLWLCCILVLPFFCSSS